MIPLSKVESRKSKVESYVSIARSGYALSCLCDPFGVGH